MIKSKKYIFPAIYLFVILATVFVPKIAFGVDPLNPNVPEVDESFIANTAKSIASLIINIAALGTIIFIIVGGFYLITSSGNPDKVKLGKRAITGALVGLVITAMAFSLSAYVENVVKRGGTNTSNPFSNIKDSATPLPTPGDSGEDATPLPLPTISEQELSSRARSTLVPLLTIDGLTCNDIREKVRYMYPEVSAQNPEGANTFYLKGIEISNEGKDVTVFYKKKANGENLYDVWTFVPNNGYKTNSRAGIVLSNPNAINNNCDIPLISDSPEQTDQTVAISNYTVKLNDGREYPIGTINNIPFIVDGDNKYEIKSEKFGTFAKINKEPIAYTRWDDKVFFDVPIKQNVVFGKASVEFDKKLVTHYIEFKNHDPEDLIAAIINENDDIIGAIFANDYKALQTNINIDGIPFIGYRGTGGYLNHPQLLKQVARVINKLQNKYGAKIAAIEIDNDDTSMMYYSLGQDKKRGAPTITMTTAIIDSAGYPENINYNLLEAILTHEYGHFFDDILLDGIPNLEFFSESGRGFSNSFINSVILAHGGEVISEKYSLLDYKTNPEAKKIVDDTNKIYYSTNSFFNSFLAKINPGSKNPEGYAFESPRELFANTFEIYNFDKIGFEEFISREENKALKNMLYVLYLSMRKITEKNFPFPYDVDRFTSLSPEDIAQANFLKLLQNQTAKADFSRPSMYGCDSIRDYYGNIYINEKPGHKIKGMAIGDMYLIVFYKSSIGVNAPESDVLYDYYVWVSAKKGYERVSSNRNIGPNNTAIINSCKLGVYLSPI